MVTMYNKHRGRRFFRIGRFMVDARWRDQSAYWSVNLHIAIAFIPKSSMRDTKQFEADRRHRFKATA